jgi:hypothetical protein
VNSGSPSDSILWQRAIDRLPDLAGSDVLRQAAEHPQQLDTIGRYLARETDTAAALNNFLQDVDESPCSLAMWLKALVAFDDCLRTSAHRPTLSQAAGYLSCCAEAAASNAQTDLSLCVRSFFEDFGYTPG